MESNFVNGDSKGGVVNISGDAQLTMQQFQHMYSLMTGKSEEIKKQSNRPVRLEIDDFYQLDKRVHQMLEQYQLAGISATYVVVLANGEKEVFSSVEKMAFQVATHNSVTESVFIKYKFAIILPHVRQPQNYMISIKADNRLAAQKRMVEELPMGVPRRIINYVTAETVDIRVEYVDFAVSRSFIANLDNWLESVHVASESSILKRARKISHYIAPFFQYISLAFLSFGIWNQLPKALAGATLVELAQSFLISFLLIFFTWRVIGFLGGRVENAVDSTLEISYLKLTKGDEKFVAEATKRNNMDLVKACVGGVMSGATSYLVKYLGMLIR